MRTLSTLSARKRQLNHLCAEAVEQQISLHKADNNHHRKRRRYLAKQVIKRVSLRQHHSNRHWLHAVTMVFALWGFNDLVVPNQAIAAPVFGNDNPFFGIPAGAKSKPTFADIDLDGDLDAFVGVYGGGVKYFRNDGTNLAPEFIADEVGNPLAGVATAGYYGYAAPTFADIDGDGDLDAFVGGEYGTVHYYRNTRVDAGADVGFVADSAGNPLAGVSVSGFYAKATPTFADVDADGDLDAFVGEGDGNIKYYRNTRIDVGADVGFVADVAGNPLAGFNVVSESTPVFADIDADGDLDAFVGERDGNIHYFRNTRIDDGADVGFVADAAGNPMGNFRPGKAAAPSFADIDGDGDLDAFVGVGVGTILYYRNTEIDPDVPGTGMVTDNPLGNFTVTNWASPSLRDIDDDGDLDVFVGDIWGTVNYFRNDGTDLTPSFVADTAGNPLDGFNVGRVAAPTFADIDGDGDQDAFVGEQYGIVKYYRNTEIDAGTDVGFVADSVGNPLAMFDVGTRSTPTFADIDGDGDLDAFVGEWQGYINYYRNTEIDAHVPGTGFVADTAANPLAAVDVGAESAITFADLDGDGDLDAFIGATAPIKYYRNTEIDTMVQGTGFVADEAGNPLAKIRVFEARPEFADIDGDGDLDVFVGGFTGSVKYYQNFDPVPVAVDDSLDAIAGIPVSTVDVTANDKFKIEAPLGTFTITAFDATTVNGATVSNNGDNSFSYTALGDFAGTDFFTYTLDDGNGITAVATVVVSVIPAIPSVDILNVPAVVNSLDPFPITVEFSEDVIGFDALTDVTVANGIVNSITPVEGNTYTVSISPDGNGDISIDIADNVATGVITGVNNAAALQAVVRFDAGSSGVGDGGGGGGALNPWSLLLLPLITWFRRKKRKHQPHYSPRGV